MSVTVPGSNGLKATLDCVVLTAHSGFRKRVKDNISSINLAIDRPKYSNKSTISKAVCDFYLLFRHILRATHIMYYTPSYEGQFYAHQRSSLGNRRRPFPSPKSIVRIESCYFLDPSRHFTSSSAPPPPSSKVKELEVTGRPISA